MLEAGAASILQMNLGRLHAMRYAKQVDSVRVLKRTPGRPWFGYEPNHLPFTSVKQPNRDADERAKESLEQAIEHFNKAIELDDKNLTAKLSLAWCHDQAGQEMQAITGYRAVIAAGWKKEKDLKVARKLGFHSIVKEAAEYLMPKLDAETDKAEIADLKSKIERVSKIVRPITPIAIPLGSNTAWWAVEARDTSVLFDADGSGIAEQWSWIRPSAGWLVYDHQAEGKITSALQMFGNVTFWCFWQHGYQPLAALDVDGDGRLRGKELRQLAIWRDANSNGISQSGEVRPVESYGIVEISCNGRRLDDHPDKIFWCPRGVKFADGTTRPTYDVVLRSAKRKSNVEKLKADR